MGLDEYLTSLERFVDDAYGRRMRSQFQSIDGRSELAMLAAPTREEYDQFCRLTEAMTPDEKQNAAQLTDEQVADIAKTAGVDPALAAIFINGFAIEKLKVKKQK